MTDMIAAQFYHGAGLEGSSRGVWRAVGLLHCFELGQRDGGPTLVDGADASGRVLHGGVGVAQQRVESGAIRGSGMVFERTEDQASQCGIIGFRQNTDQWMA